MMKRLLMILITGLTVIQAGFFNEEEEQTRQKMLENDRLCKLFKQKAEHYKKKMRNDILAKTTYASYLHRAEIFCGKAKDLNKTLQEYEADKAE